MRYVPLLVMSWMGIDLWQNEGEMWIWLGEGERERRTIGGWLVLVWSVFKPERRQKGVRQGKIIS